MPPKDVSRSEDVPNLPRDTGTGVGGGANRGKPEASYIRVCPVCGQEFDGRDLDQVLLHSVGPHDPLP